MQAHRPLPWPGAAVVMLSAACALVMAAVIPWGDFHDHTHWAKVDWIPFVSRPVRLRDVVQNVLLFVPVGIGAALVFRRGVGAAAIMALALSLTGEVLQLYSHNRFPSATDVVCNLAGALASAYVVRRSRQLRRRAHAAQGT